MSVLLLLLFCLFSFIGYGTSPLQTHLIHRYAHRTHMVKKLKQAGVDPLPDMAFDNFVDHFNPQNRETYPQRYWVDDTHYEKGGPVFLCVEGEGPAIGGYVFEYLFANAVELAPKENALLVALEHRYYGDSYPTRDLTTPNMEFLSSHQALADLANFVQFMMKNLPEGTKWVTYGGSYPGMLSGWARLKFPTAIHASVASSAPVYAMENMVGYNDVVAQSLSDPKVGGSVECYEAVKSGHQVIGEMLMTEFGQMTLLSEFNFCPGEDLSTPENQVAWAGFGVIGIDVQNNDVNCQYADLCNIGQICDVLTNGTYNNELDAFTYVSGVKNDNECVSLDMEDDYVMNTTINDMSWLRAWVYQTCSQFGFYQTCQVGSDCPWPQGLYSLEMFEEDCLRAFRIDQQQIQENIAFTNAYYGADNPQASRIIWPNGKIDPWHNLSVLEPPNHDEQVLMVEGASHCAWMRLSQDDDPVDIKDARAKIMEQISIWLMEN